LFLPRYVIEQQQNEKQGKEIRRKWKRKDFTYLFTNVKDDFNIIDDEEKQEKKDENGDIHEIFSSSRIERVLTFPLRDFLFFILFVYRRDAGRELNFMRNVS
jgi:hypothetical protein